MKSLNKLKRWWKLDGRYLHYKIKYGIRNLYKWFPIIWKDRSWDHSYIWKLLEHKLKLHGNAMKKYGHHVDSERDAERMYLCTKLIEKIRDEYYRNEYYDYQKVEIHWDDLAEDIKTEEDIYSKEGLKELRIEEKGEHLNDYFAKYPLIYKQVMATEKPIFFKDNKRGVALNIGFINHQRAKNLLFKILNEHLEAWWN